MLLRLFFTLERRNLLNQPVLWEEEGVFWSRQMGSGYGYVTTVEGCSLE
jgi:hypothetical protein